MQREVKKMEKNTKILKLTIFTAVVFGLGFFVSFSEAQAIEKLEARNIKRISHPAYTITYSGNTQISSINVNNSRVLLYDGGIMSDKTYEIHFHPSFPTTFLNARGQRYTHDGWNAGQGNVAWGNWVAVGSIGEYKTQLGYEPSAVQDDEGDYLTENDGGAGNLASGYYDYVPSTGYMHVNLNNAGSNDPDLVPARLMDNARGYFWGCLSESCKTEATNRNSICTAEQSPFSCCTGSGIGNCEPYSTLQALDLDNATGNQSLVDWERNTFTIPYGYQSVQWSPYPGETNIIYALKTANKDLVVYNLDTGVERVIFDYELYYETSYDENIAIIGFTKNATSSVDPHHDQIVIMYNYNYNGMDKQRQPVIVVDTKHDIGFVGAATIAGFGKADLHIGIQTCDAEAVWYPNIHDVHNNISPDGLYEHGSAGAFKTEDLNGRCSLSTNPLPNTTTGPPYLAKAWTMDRCSMGQTTACDSSSDLNGTQYSGQTHISHMISNDWYLIANASSFPQHGSRYSPHIDMDGQRIYQTIFDRNLFEEAIFGKADCDDPNNPYSYTGACPCPLCFKSFELVRRSSADQWTTPTSYVGTIYENNNLPEGESTNYGNFAMPSLSNDGAMFVFRGTNNKYTRDDRSWCDILDAVNSGWTTCATIGTNWEGIGTYIAELISGDNPIDPADVNDDSNVNIKDIQICIKAIVDRTKITDAEYQKCQAVALPDTVVNIKDIQGIIREIIK